MVVQLIENISSDGVAIHPNSKRGKRRTSAPRWSSHPQRWHQEKPGYVRVCLGRGGGRGGAFASPPDKSNPSPQKEARELRPRSGVPIAAANPWARPCSSYSPGCRCVSMAKPPRWCSPLRFGRVGERERNWGGFGKGRGGGRHPAGSDKCPDIQPFCRRGKKGISKGGFHGEEQPVRISQRSGAF